MTKIYALNQDDAFQALVQVNAKGEVAYEDSVAIRATSLCGKPFGEDYKSINLSWSSSRGKKDSDVHAMLSPFLVFSGKAFESLSCLLLNNGQVLAVESPVVGMKGFHITRAVDDAIDMDESIFKVYPQATVFNKIVLLEERVRGIDIFRLKEKPSMVFVSEKFKEMTENHKLRGFNFGEPVRLFPRVAK
jgi:hypothetical protein